MSRHSKGANASAVYSSAERQKLFGEYGVKRERVEKMHCYPMTPALFVCRLPRTHFAVKWGIWPVRPVSMKAFCIKNERSRKT